MAGSSTSADGIGESDSSDHYSSTSDKTNHKSSSKYLSCALLVWELTVRQAKKLCCCCLITENAASRQFLWNLFKANASMTTSYFLMYFAFGMCVGFLGPTLEDLACYTMQPVSKISMAFFAQTCFMVVGIFICGCLSRCISADFMLLVSLICLPVTLVVVSFSKYLYVLALMMAIMGLAMGAIDCLANLQLVHIYDKAVAPFLQAMHFCYGLGALISPLIAQNFLLGEDCSSLVRNITLDHTTESNLMSLPAASINLSDNQTEITHDEVELIEAHHNTKVNLAFLVMAAIQVPIVVYVFVSILRNGVRIRTVNEHFKRLVNSESKPILQGLNKKEEHKAENKKLLTQWTEYLSEFQGSYSISFTKAALLTLAACAMVFIYDGLQGHVNVYTYTYSVKTLQDEEEHKKSLGMMNVYFWLAYSAGRLLSIVMAVKLTPYFMLLVSVLVTIMLQVGSQIAVFIFLSCIGGNSLTALILGNIVLGLSMSSVTPTTITMTEHFMDMTSIQMSLIIGGAALGEMVIPLIEGQLIDASPPSFVMLMLVLVGVSWLVYAIFWLMGRVTKKYKAIASPSFIWYNPDQLDYSQHSGLEESSSAVLEACNYSQTNVASGNGNSNLETTSSLISQEIETKLG